MVNQLNKAIDMQNKKLAKTDAKYKKIIEDMRTDIKSEISQTIYDLEERIERMGGNS